jgi:hypothetical protein
MTKRLVVFGGIFAALAMGSAVAFGALPFSGDGTAIKGCYSSGGNLKVLTPSEPACPKGYTPIQWNATGPQGAPGPQGATGPEGAQGPPGPSHAYEAHNSHVIETQSPFTVVGLVELPAGKYIFSTTLVNRLYHDGDQLFGADLSCSIKVNGQIASDETSHVALDEEDMYTPVTHVVPLTVPVNTSYTVACQLFDPLGNEASLAFARVTALQVSAIN